MTTAEILDTLLECLQQPVLPKKKDMNKHAYILMTVLNEGYDNTIAFMDPSGHVTREPKCALLFNTEEDAEAAQMTYMWQDDFIVLVDRDDFIQRELENLDGSEIHH